MNCLAPIANSSAGQVFQMYETDVIRVASKDTICHASVQYEFEDYDPRINCIPYGYPDGGYFDAPKLSLCEIDCHGYLVCYGSKDWYLIEQDLYGTCLELGNVADIFNERGKITPIKLKVRLI